METVSQSVAYKINTPRVAHQTIDGETIIIDFDNGAYYSTDKAGAEIWDLVANGLPVPAIIDTLAQRYSSHAALADAVTGFLAELQQESLISPIAAADSLPPKPSAGVADGSAPYRPAQTGFRLSPRPELPMGPPSPSAAGLPIFEKPKLGKYSDMQDLLLADPIHEVDEQGWPLQQGDSAR